jgi:mycothiol synthase
MCEHLSPAERLEILALLDRIVYEDMREAIDEGRRRVVVHGWPARHWLLRNEDGALVSYAQASGDDPTVVEMAGGRFDEELFARVIADTHELDWWTRGGEGRDLRGELVRTLDLMEVDLPVEVAGAPAGVTMRTFEPGRDNDAWIAQNNKAFADHPEQGAWRSEDLTMRIAEPWFDPSGFLLFEADEEIVASCWTKVHELHPERFGEIYVISVLPSAQGRGLGRVAVTQGLELLRRKGVSRAALFVDDTNESALALYRAIGFEVVREDHLVHFHGPTGL